MVAELMYIHSSEIGTFLSSLQKTYEKMDPKQYPYVLGYGISQKIPHPVTGTPMFLPSTYTFSTTPYDKDKEQASLNFGMINANDHSLDDPKIKDNPSAGVFTPPFVYQTRAVNLKSDGVFAVSNALYFRQWLQKAILTPFDSGKRLAADMNCKVTSGPTITGGVGAREASSKTSWSGDWCKVSLSLFNVQYRCSGFPSHSQLESAAYSFYFDRKYFGNTRLQERPTSPTDRGYFSCNKTRHDN